MSVFKAYDIRGTYPDQIDEQLADRLGDAFARFLGAGPVAVGRDMRTMAPSVQEAVMQGVQRAGSDVIDMGLCSTPMAYFGIGHLGAAGGLNTTASHNPKEYIGFKLTREEAIPVSGDTGIKEIEQACLATAPDPAGEAGSRSVSTGLLEAYADHVASFATLNREVKIAADAANGMAAHTFPAVLDRVPQLHCDPLYFELDGTFPNHEANPLRDELLGDLADLVRTSDAEMGAAFDGDADRCRFLDENGNPIGNDIITTLIARDVLRTNPGAAIVYDLRSSWVLREEILKAGGRPIEERVGHSFLKERMREFDCPFGGELSGHYYFRENYYADNAEIILLKVAEMMARSDRPLSAMVADLQRYHSTGEVNFRVPDTDEAIAKLKAAFKDGALNELDGATISYGDLETPGWWWFNLRASNTEPLLRLNLEADERSRMDEMTAKVIEIVGVEPEA